VPDEVTPSPPIDREVVIPIASFKLQGRLTLPDGAGQVVVFAHGSGSSRHSPRNQQVARVLQDRGLGTLLFDLLVPEEEADRGNVFNIPLLGRRLLAATAWLEPDAGFDVSRIAYFGASTGAAAALWAAAETDVAAIVSRGGRPDLAGPRLVEVAAPTLLIVGGKDTVVLELNRQAQSQLRAENDLVVVPGATHLFEEPGALQVVADLAAGWFLAHGGRAPRR
jgi:putative phosphoribosyl transferase